MSETVVAALYKFVALPDYQALRDQLHELCKQQGIKGTLLFAPEGINGTVAGTRAAIDTLQAALDTDGRFEGMEYKETIHSDTPFLRLKTKLKREIVTMGIEDTDPNEIKGTYVDAQGWNQLLADPDTLVIDTRNDYEVAVGKFEGAISPDTVYFREFPAYVENELKPNPPKKVAMYCTGGIRCEKASNYLMRHGFEEVYHLKGGILQYLEDVDPEQNRWHGECFVFDERVAVDKNLQQGEHVLCRACRMPVSLQQRQDPRFEDGVSCPQCYDNQSETNRERARERMKQINLAKARGEKHLGPRG